MTFAGVGRSLLICASSATTSPRPARPKRVIPGIIIEKLVLGDDGTMQPLVAPSTRPVAQTLVHAGIVWVRRYGFIMP